MEEGCAVLPMHRRLQLPVLDTRHFVLDPVDATREGLSRVTCLLQMTVSLMEHLEAKDAHGRMEPRELQSLGHADCWSSTLFLTCEVPRPDRLFPSRVAEEDDKRAPKRTRGGRKGNIARSSDPAKAAHKKVGGSGSTTARRNFVRMQPKACH
jgi:hypothetical protein